MVPAATNSDEVSDEDGNPGEALIVVEDAVSEERDEEGDDRHNDDTDAVRRNLSTKNWKPSQIHLRPRHVVVCYGRESLTTEDRVRDTEADHTDEVEDDREGYTEVTKEIRSGDRKSRDNDIPYPKL